MDPAVSFPEKWTAPAELSRAMPREVRMAGSGIFLAVVAVVLLVAAIPVVMFLRNQETRRAAQAESLREAGVEVQAEVTRLWHSGKESRPMVSYEFAFEGRRYGKQSSVPRGVWSGLYVGGPLRIRFLPANPAINRPVDRVDGSAPAWMPPAFGAGLAAVGALFLVLLRRQAQLLAEGVPAAGVVTKCYRVKGGWSARYQFRTQDGSVRKGACKVRRPMENGETVCVLYVPENRRLNGVYPLNMYRLRDAGEF